MHKLTNSKFWLLDPKKTQVVFNSSWMNSMGAGDLVRLACIDSGSYVRT